ncbi:hypothetical protein [Roseibium aggregatum]|uniref:hypothetical protein n=1 Tax=Roseibium aggregatum TaxID=187304 RepID=UPI0002FE5962|nr:hypothetical protein [Roseibium aggregatum]
MKSLKFLVSGREAVPYEVIAKRSGNNFKMTCTCMAGAKGTHCKHRINLLLGDVTSLWSENAKDVEKLAEMVEGTDVQAALADMMAAERAVESAKKHLDGTKKALARKLLD